MTSRWIRSAPAFWTRWTAYCEVRQVGVEDARGDARPTVGHRLLPHPDRRRVVTALAEQGRRALGDEPRAAAGDGRGRRLTCPLGGELAARRADLLAAVAADGRLDAGVAEGRREAPR